MIATATAWALAALEFVKALPRWVWYAAALPLVYCAGCVHGCHAGH